MGVDRFNDKVMKVSIVIRDLVWEVVSCYCPQTGRSVIEKEEFYELMDKVVTSEKVLVGGDVNGNIGSDMAGFGVVHGAFGIGQINDGGIKLLGLTVGKVQHLRNTCFQKMKSWLITFRLDETETITNYILVNNKCRGSVKDVKVVTGEEIVNNIALW